MWRMHFRHLSFSEENQVDPNADDDDDDDDIMSIFRRTDFESKNEVDDFSRKRNLSLDSNEETEEPLTKKPRRVQLRGNKNPETYEYTYT